MKYQILLKLACALMVLVGLFGITAGVFGIRDTLKIKSSGDSENASIRAKISDIQDKSETLGSERSTYTAEKTFLKNNKTKYDSDKAAYDILKDSYDTKAAQFEASKKAKELDASAIAQTQKILDEGAARLKTAKAKLSEYETALAYVSSYDDNQTAVDTELTLLSQDKAVSDRIADGEELIDAVKTALAAKTADDTKKFITALCLCAAAILAAILALWASALALRAAACRDSSKTKKSAALCILGLILSFFACFYGATAGFLSEVVLIAALASETVAIVFLFSTAEKYRKTLSLPSIQHDDI